MNQMHNQDERYVNTRVDPAQSKMSQASGQKSSLKDLTEK